MNKINFDPNHSDELPTTIPIFPLSGMILLPRSFLPLNIFEPRYINMVNEAMANGRYIGMIQPKIESEEGRGAEAEDDKVDKQDDKAELYKVGCLGRIIHFEEEPEGRYEIVLKGVIRFSYIDDETTEYGFRQADVAYDDYDYDINLDEMMFNRLDFIELLKKYFDASDIGVDWDGLKQADDERLVNSLCMLAPFTAMEKQTLLEAKTAMKRIEIMTSFMKMTIMNGMMEYDQDKLQ